MECLFPCRRAFSCGGTSADSDGVGFGPGCGERAGACLGFHYVVLDVHGTRLFFVNVKDEPTS